MTLSALGIFSAAGAGGVVAGSYELIETQILGTSAASITFSSLGTYASTYRHLQIRHLTRNTTSGTSNDIIIARLNGDTGANYNQHYIAGTGSSVLAGNFALSAALVGVTFENSNTTNAFMAGITDIFDPFSTTKNKTFSTLTGGHSSTVTRSDLHTSAWRNTSSVTSIQLLPATNSFAAGSRFSLYGLK
jgi:hypothetical protein